MVPDPRAEASFATLCPEVYNYCVLLNGNCFLNTMLPVNSLFGKCQGSACFSTALPKVRLALSFLGMARTESLCCRAGFWNQM